MTLFTLDRTAHHTRLHLVGDVVYLLTPKAAFRLIPGEAAHEQKLDLGETGVATPAGFVFWSQGALWLAPQTGSAPGRLVELERRPRLIVAVEEGLAWVERDEQGRDTIYRLRGGSPKNVYASRGRVDAATMIEDQVVFVEGVGDASWRLGAVSMPGGRRAFTRPRKGRSPTMLVAAGEIYYYDGYAAEVRAVSPDLQRERVVGGDVECSPIAVADRIYCAQGGGLFELPAGRGVPKAVLANASARVVDIAADNKRVVWVGQTRRGMLEVKLLARSDARAR